MNPSSTDDWAVDTVEHCRSCGAPVVWLKHHTTGRASPIDIEPSESGNIEVDLADQTYNVLSRREMEMAKGKKLYVSHFATCPQANQWKKPSIKENVKRSG